MKMTRAGVLNVKRGGRHENIGNIWRPGFVLLLFSSQLEISLVDGDFGTGYFYDFCFA